MLRPFYGLTIRNAQDESKALYPLQKSAGQRVRTALNIKGVDYEYTGVGCNGSIS
jgi:hypothetical protein